MEDYGVDLHCTLTKPMGQRAVVTDYYSVQVKSNDEPWKFETSDEIRWVFEYPTPLFLACVDKSGGVLFIYHTMPRFLAGFYPAPPLLELEPTALDDGQCHEDDLVVHMRFFNVLSASVVISEARTQHVPSPPDLTNGRFLHLDPIQKTKRESSLIDESGRITQEMLNLGRLPSS